MTLQVLVSCLCSSSVLASNNASLQINTVKSLYNQCIGYEKENRRNIDNPYYESKDCREILYKLASNDFKKAIAMEKDFEKKYFNEGYICDAIYIWDSQDPDYNAKLTFTNLPNNKVKVKFGYGGHVTYSLSCNKNKCQITDLFNRNNLSQKNIIFQECQ
ncbi:hypothetical protein [Psychrobacter sp. I-STPA10]|uniref:hypothetical protein n=1 Tax=Psychrobacter sp. I-STPA10 TaxID=2585769 RepID=UPI001E546F6A|nr:hypothetical protein [Psychrobacter sp. I-STPA10]